MEEKLILQNNYLNSMMDSLKNLRSSLACLWTSKKYPPQDCDDTKLEIDFLLIFLQIKLKLS